MFMESLNNVKVMNFSKIACQDFLSSYPWESIFEEYHREDYYNPHQRK